MTPPNLTRMVPYYHIINVKKNDFTLDILYYVDNNVQIEVKHIPSNTTKTIIKPVKLTDNNEVDVNELLADAEAFYEDIMLELEEKVLLINGKGHSHEHSERPEASGA